MVYRLALVMSLNTPDKKLNYSPSCHSNPTRHGEHNWRYFWWNLRAFCYSIETLV